METSTLVLLILAVLVVAAVIIGFVLAQRKRTQLPPTPPATPSAAPETKPPRPESAEEPTVESVEDSADLLTSAEHLEVIEQEVDIPTATAGRLVRLRDRLARSQSTLGQGLLKLLSSDKLDEDTWEDLEAVLLAADVGIGPTTELVDKLRTQVRVQGVADPAAARALLRAELLQLIGPDTDRSLTIAPDGPSVVLVVGVNGTGKTTTTGKIARVLIADGHSVVLGAADTFRAAAAEQLQTWGDRVGASVVRGPEGGDPASVAFDAVETGIKEEVNAVLIDTAGRLHTKTGLMDELGKVKRVAEKQRPVNEVLLVLDATTGQNGLTQARVFAEVVDVTGIVLTKLDGTAKGGIVIAVQQELGVPVKYVGLGEGPDDLAPFEPEAFVNALLGE